MPLYTVLQPPIRPGDAAPDPMGTLLVKEGFSWPALVIPELWLIFRRMWLVFLLYLGATLLVIMIDGEIGGPLPGVFLALAHLLFALEGNGLRRWTLERRGYAVVGVVQGDRLADAELRFFHEQEEPPESRPQEPTSAAAPAPAASPSPAAPPPPRSDEAGEIVGLFPAPGGRS